MGVIALFHVPATDFPLGTLLEVREGIRVRVESVVPSGDALFPYFSVPNTDADAVHEVLRDSSLVEEVRVIDAMADETMFRVKWSPDVDGLLDAIVHTEGAVLESEGLGDRWSFRIRFPEHEQLSAFYRSCTDKGIALELKEVNQTRSFDDTELSLTDPQREALLTALSEGYYRVPREITLRELAEKLDISDTALSQRLRRGLAVLIASTLNGGRANERDD